MHSLLKHFFKNNESVTATQRAFCLHFKLKRHDPQPTRNTILLWVANFRISGSTLKRKSPGRTRSARTPANIDAVNASIHRSPKRSARKHAISLGLSKGSLNRILHKDLKMHQYKMVLVQELSERYFENRRLLCMQMQQHFPRAAFVIFSDEAHFHLCGSVNMQNFRYWSEINPCELQERPLHSPHVTVWCALSEFGIWGPYSFENDNGTVLLLLRDIVCC